MRAAVFHKAGEPLSIETVADPKVRPDDVVLKVANAGICGTDLHMTQYAIAPDGTVLGHEFAGTIVEVGKNVKGDWKIGDRVTALPLRTCMACEYCDAGFLSHCSRISFNGMSLKLPGGYAEYVSVWGSMMQKLPDGVSFAVGAMVEPLAVARHVVEIAEMPAGASVLVLGAGPIGAAVALFARLDGARHVVVSEPFADRRQRALAVGATHIIDPGAEKVAEAFAKIAGRAPELVYECVGNPGMVRQAIDLVGHRGRVVVAGACFVDDTIQPFTPLFKEVNIQYANCYSQANYAYVIDALAKGKANAKPLHTATVGFSNFPAAFESLRGPSTNCKILLDPSLP